MNFVIPSRDPATTPKTKYEKEIQYSLLKLGPNTSVVAASLRMGNNIKMAKRTSHRDRLGLNSRQTLYTWIVVHTYWLKLAWIFLIFNFTIKFWQVIEIIFTLDGFTNFWELLHKKRNSRANCFPSCLLPFPLISVRAARIARTRFFSSNHKVDRFSKQIKGNGNSSCFPLTLKMSRLETSRKNNCVLSSLRD